MRLAIRTSSGAYGAALLAVDGAVIASREGQGSATAPGDLVAALLQAAGCAPGDLTGVLVDLGPGGLSSTRVGVSFANAFAHGAGLALAGVSALDLQAQQARVDAGIDAGAKPLVSLRPAPGGQVFWALYPATTATEAGCAPLPALLSDLRARLGRFALTGPLARLKGFDPAIPGVTALPIDPPPLAAFAHVSPRPAPRADGIALLAPLTEARALLPPQPDPPR